MDLSKPTETWTLSLSTIFQSQQRQTACHSEKKYLCVIFQVRNSVYFILFKASYSFVVNFVLKMKLVIVLKAVIIYLPIIVSMLISSCLVLKIWTPFSLLCFILWEQTMYINISGLEFQEKTSGPAGPLSFQIWSPAQVFQSPKIFEPLCTDFFRTLCISTRQTLKQP